MLLSGNQLLRATHQAIVLTMATVVLLCVSPLPTSMAASSSPGAKTTVSTAPEATATNSMLKTADVPHPNQTQRNMVAFVNYLVWQRRQQLQQLHHHKGRQQKDQYYHPRNGYDYDAAAATPTSNDGGDQSVDRTQIDAVIASRLGSDVGNMYQSPRRSSETPGTFNGLQDPSGWRQINSGYGASDTQAVPSATITTTAFQKQQIPIHEDQQENNYGKAAGAEAAESRSYSQDGSINRAIYSYNLHTAVAHNDVDNDYNNGNNIINNNHNRFSQTVSSYPSHTLASMVTAGASPAPAAAPAPAPPYYRGGDDDNFQRHYRQHKVGYDNDLTAADSVDAHSTSDEEQLQYFNAPHADTPLATLSSSSLPASSSSSSLPSSYPSDVAGAISFEHSQSSPYFDEEDSNKPSAIDSDAYSSLSATHSDTYSGHTHKQPNVINYIPYPVVKKVHVPIHEPIQIPFSHAVVVPIRKPVPIHIPITQQVHVPVEQELKIPVERVVPYPVEKQVPVPVEKRVPYPVVKYVPVKIPRPFPVKVPVFKTVLHKVKGWW